MKSKSKSVTNLLAWIGAAGLVAVLLKDHALHVTRVLPFLFLMACPLLHVFHHGGHASHGGERTHTAHEPPHPADTAGENPALTTPRVS